MAAKPFSRRRAEFDGTLAALRPGERATVTGLASADPRLNRRFLDLGFAPGAEIVAVRQAPLRDPIIFRVADCEIALRRRDAAAIQVHRVAAP